MHFAVSRWVAAGVFLPMFLAGCGNQYRPVVTATNPVGPAGQPIKYAVAISSTAGNGLVSFIDFSGDTVITTPSIQANPNYIALNGGGTEGYTINAAGTLDQFQTSNPNSLITSNIAITTLPASAAPVTVSSATLTGSTASVFVPEPGRDSIAALNASGELIQEVSVAPAPTPAYVVGVNGTSRIYALGANGTAAGTASAIEASTTAGLSVSASIPVGVNPVYGVMTADTRRAFVLNKGSQTITVINVPSNALDSGVTAQPATPTTPATTLGTLAIPTYTDAAGNNLASNPVWADLNPLTSELVVLSQGDGVHGGLVTIFNIPLCNADAQPTNPNCNVNNPVDGVGFGTIVGQAPVGVNPQMVSVLQDPLTPRAYVANMGNASTPGSVSVVNLTSGVTTATLSTSADNADNLAQTTVFGLLPQTIAATYAYPTGKVYVTSGDSKYLTIIYTDTDSVSTHVPLQGTGVRVAVTAP